MKTAYSDYFGKRCDNFSVNDLSRYSYANTFKRTRVWEQVGQACDVAINENVIVVVYGRPGIGKSRCLTEYALQKMRTAPITVLCSRNITPRFFIQKLAKELRIERQWTIPDLEEAVAEQLTRYPRPLFIDQANFLHKRSLGTVCHLWELARLSIVLLGTKALFELFIKSKLTEEVRDQLSSRSAALPAFGAVAEGSQSNHPAGDGRRGDRRRDSANLFLDGRSPSACRHDHPANFSPDGVE